MGYKAVLAQIDEACRNNQRVRDSVTLVAVTKNHDTAAIENLITQGQKVFGENRVQDAAAKWNDLRRRHTDVNLHFIGHLQTNKAKEAVALFDVIETVDSERLADALSAEMKKQNRSLPCFIQVNTGAEEQKGGVAIADLPALYKHCRETGLDIKGLMCIPPAGDIPDMHFALLHKLAGELGVKDLSMGMSADFDRAIAFGASHIRIGSALFD